MKQLLSDPKMKQAAYVLLALLLGAFVLGLMVGTATAEPLPTECNTYSHHSGHIPARYDYAEFWEFNYPSHGQTVYERHETNGQSIYVAPPQGRRDWDKVKKCKYPPTTTTTTTTSTTTTTQPPTTTTPSTVPPTSSTTSTSQPPPTTTTTTTVVTTTTTTVPSTTTTTVPTTTTSTTTTSTVPPATTSTTVVQPTTTTSADTTTTVVVVTEVPKGGVDTGAGGSLPHTGMDALGWFALIGAGFIALGLAFLWASREAALRRA